MTNLSVVHAVPNLGIGGTQKALELLIKNIDADRFDASVVGIDDGGERAEILRDEGFDVFIADGSVGDITNHFISTGVDILHLHGASSGPIAVPAARNADVPIVVKTDNFGWGDEPSVMKHIDRYYFMSKMTLLRYLLIHQIPLDDGWQNQYDVLYNPLVAPSVDGEAGASFRERHDIPQASPLVGKIGRPRGPKWGRITVDAFEHIVRQKPESRLALVTPPEKIKRKLMNGGLSDKVVYIDRIPPEDVDKFYQAIDVLTHSSAMGETFGYVLAEALANETPVVVNSNPMRDNAQIEVVDHAETGYVANSTRAYAEATIELLADETRRTTFGAGGRDRVLSRYSADSITAKLEREYLSLAHEHGLDGGEDTQRSPADIAAFQSAYRSRLDTYYGDPDLTYRVERRLWDVTTRLSAKRELAYKAARLGLTYLDEDIGL